MFESIILWWQNRKEKALLAELKKARHVRRNYDKYKQENLCVMSKFKNIRNKQKGRS